MTHRMPPVILPDDTILVTGSYGANFVVFDGQAFIVQFGGEWVGPIGSLGTLEEKTEKRGLLGAREAVENSNVATACFQSGVKSRSRGGGGGYQQDCYYP